MRTLSILCRVGLTGAILMTPVVLSLQAQDRDEHRDDSRSDDARRYHDAKTNEEHEWNASEDQAYRHWLQERHRKYVDFGKLKSDDQRAYWECRRSHADAHPDEHR